MKNKINSNEKGSVVLIVSITVIFILIVLSVSLTTVSLKRKTQLMDSKKLQEVYDVDMDKIYDELILKKEYSQGTD